MQYELINTPNKSLTITEQILFNRGIPLSDTKQYLNTSDEDILPPSSIAHMKDGVNMLMRHIKQNDNVLIQIDSDCDGYTSAAIFINYLNCLFPGFVQNNIVYRVHTGKQHGLIPETVSEDIKLVILLDSSSNNYKEHKMMKDRGIDVLVIDHHEADYVSEDACVINNQLCDYPNKTLCGAAMTYKFCYYIDELLETNYANKFLDLVALGLTADMVDLRNFETKHLVKKGIQQIQNPYFQKMVEIQSFQLKDGITSFGIAFYIAPYVNATIRVGSQEEKLMLFESMLDHRAYEQVPSTKRGCKGQTETRVEQACRNCTNIKNRQTKARDESLNKIEQIIEEKQLLKNKILVITLDKSEEVNKNLTGLVANQLMSEYQRPVLLLNETEGKYEGSARNVGMSNFSDFRAFCANSELVEYAEGHKSAFGFGIKKEKLNDFIEYSNRALAEFDFSPAYKVDFIFDVSNISPEDILEIASLKSLWGQGVETSLIALENVKVTKENLQLMSKDKRPTLKINLPNNIGSLIKFRSSNEEYESLYSELGCVTINIVGECERNEWNGKITPQILVEDYEIVDRINYYF